MTTDSSDPRKELVRMLVAAGAGDRAAFAEVYRRTRAKLFGICLRICGERQAAEDVLQDVYVTIWHRAGAYEPGRASPISWLATIARNRSIDWRRTQGRRAAVPVEEASPLPDPGPGAEALLLLDEEERRLHACLSRLSDAQRDAIRTAFFDGLTYAELAARGDVPLGTIKSWVRRGLMRLKECLDDAA